MKGVVKTVLDLPIAFPELVPGLCLLLLFGSTFVGTLFNALGLQFVFTKQGTVVAQFFTALPYASRIRKSTFDYIDPKLEFVSRSLGYSIWETFRNVSLPLAKNGILAATVISFARCIGTFGTVLILGGGTYMKTEVLPMTLYFNISYGNMGMALTSGIVLTVVSFEAIYFLNGPRWAYELPGGCRSACPAGGVPVGGDFTGPRPWRLPDHHRPHRCRQDDFHRSPGGVLAAGSGADSSWRPEQRHIGIVYQDYALMPHMTVFRNIAYGLKKHKGRNLEQNVRQMAASLLRGTVVSAEKDGSRVDIGGVCLTSLGAAAPGDKVDVAIRHEAITLQKERPVSAKGFNVVPAVLDHVMPEGPAFMVDMRANGIGLQALVSHDTPQRLQSREGDPMYALIPKQHVQIVNSHHLTGSTLVNNTYHTVIGDRPLVFYVVTVSGIAYPTDCLQYCQCGH